MAGQHTHRSPSFGRGAGLSIYMTLALVSFAIWGEVTRKAKLPGLLMAMAGMLTLRTPQAGVLAEVLAHEGDLLQAGQLMMRLKSEHNTALGDTVNLNA